MQLEYVQVIRKGAYFKGNPKLEVLYPLVRALKMDSREIFQPERCRETPAIRRLRFIVEECSEKEAAALIPAIEGILTVLRSRTPEEIE